LNFHSAINESQDEVYWFFTCVCAKLSPFIYLSSMYPTLIPKQR
jgi:hypothetical protein